MSNTASTNLSSLSKLTNQSPTTALTDLTAQLQTCTQKLTNLDEHKGVFFGLFALGFLSADFVHKVNAYEQQGEPDFNYAGLDADAVTQADARIYQTVCGYHLDPTNLLTNLVSQDTTATNAQTNSVDVLVAALVASAEQIQATASAANAPVFSSIFANFTHNKVKDFAESLLASRSSLTDLATAFATLTTQALANQAYLAHNPTAASDARLASANARLTSAKDNSVVENANSGVNVAVDAAVGDDAADKLAQPVYTLEQLLDQLIQRVATESNHTGADFFTSQQVADLTASLVTANLQPTSRLSVYDPCCGSATLLLRTAQAAHLEQPVHLYGHDVNKTMLGLANLNALVSQQPVPTFSFSATDVFNAEFDQDSYAGRFDLVVAEPPSFFELGAGQAQAVQERYSALGFTKIAGSSAFVLHALDCLAEHGAAALVLDDSFFSLPSIRKVRKHLIDQNLVDAVISLPSIGLLAQAKRSILILRKDRNERGNKQVAFVEAKEKFEASLLSKGDKRQWKLSADGFAQVHAAYANKEEVAGFSKQVDLELISKNNCSLAVSQYVFAGVDGVNLEDTEQSLKNLVDEISVSAQKTQQLATQLKQNLAEFFGSAEN